MNSFASAFCLLHLRMMGLFKGRALCFCVDTTGSMGDDIDAVRTVTSSIIDSKVGTEDEPSIYILVPFNDPGRIPMFRAELYFLPDSFTFSILNLIYGNNHDRNYSYSFHVLYSHCIAN